LTALYHVTESTPGQFTCSIQLPINSPYKETIVGPAMPSLELSKRAAALETCKRLHQIKELDDYMLPIGKDGPKKEWEPKPR
jgi:endoribonuclease Dicer